MKRELGLLVLVWQLCGCSGKSSQSDDDASGGEGGSGGSGAANAGFGAGGQGATGSMEPPPSQAAFRLELGAPSPAMPGKACPVGASFTSEAPSELPPGAQLDGDTYLQHVIDGEAGAAVSCSVAETASGFAFEADVSAGIRGLVLAGGSIEDGVGSAQVTVMDRSGLSSPLTSPIACRVEAMPTTAATLGLQIKAGSMWARFTCSTVEAPPSDACAASGFFVLENCAQD